MRAACAPLGTACSKSLVSRKTKKDWSKSALKFSMKFIDTYLSKVVAVVERQEATGTHEQRGGGNGASVVVQG